MELPDKGLKLGRPPAFAGNMLLEQEPDQRGREDPPRSRGILAFCELRETHRGKTPAFAGNILRKVKILLA